MKIILSAAFCLAFLSTFAVDASSNDLGEKQTVSDLEKRNTTRSTLPVETHPSTSLSSTGDRIDWQVLSNGGGWSGTTGFLLFGVLHQTATGESANNEFRLHHGFLQDFATSSCCIGVTGNVDCDAGNVVDIADLTIFIDYMFLSLTPLCCMESANIDGDPLGEVTFADLTKLIDHLFISLDATAACQ